MVNNGLCFVCVSPRTMRRTWVLLLKSRSSQVSGFLSQWNKGGDSRESCIDPGTDDGYVSNWEKTTKEPDIGYLKHYEVNLAVWKQKRRFLCLAWSPPKNIRVWEIIKANRTSITVYLHQSSWRKGCTTSTHWSLFQEKCISQSVTVRCLIPTVQQVLQISVPWYGVHERRKCSMTTKQTVYMRWDQ